MLGQRLLVAAIGLPLLALLIAAPEPAFALAVQVLLAFAAYEMTTAAEPHAPRSYALGAAAAVALFTAIARTSAEVPVALLLAVTAGTVAALLIPATRLAGTAGGWWMGAVLYVAVPGAHFILARNLVEGREWLVTLLAITFATDTGAYAVGRLFGRHRLAPAISPNKTVEGAMGGLAAGAGAALAAPLLLGTSIASTGAALLAIVVPIAAMAGDLLESALKRRLGVKDMSGLLPGHGGLLDRLDSLLLAGPCLYWIVRWFQVVP